MTRITKAFEPYSVLWTTTDNWLKWSKSWMNDSFMTLAPNDMTNQVENSLRALQKILKSPVISDNAGCNAICSKIKDEMEVRFCLLLL